MLMLESRVTFAPQLRGNRAACPLPSPRAGIRRRKGGVGRALVHEDEVPALNSAGYQNPPSSSQELVAFCRTHRASFGLNPMRLKSLLRVDSLTDTPATPSTKRHLSLSVRAALCSPYRPQATSWLAHLSWGVDLGASSRRERAALASLTDITLHRGETHPERTSGFALTHPPVLYGLHYLPTQIF